MTIEDIQVSDQTYQYFLQESVELLQTMDDELQDLRENFSVQKVHNLMRAAHTLKGASASVGLDAVKKTTHSLEDVFKALCHQDTIISVEMEGLIFQSYDCLKLLMSSQLAGAQIDEADILDRMAASVTRLQEMLGDRFGQGGHLPTSSELGFDMTQSIFEVGVAQRIEALEEALKDPDEDELADLLSTQAEVFIGLSESLDLPGFGEIGRVTLQARKKSPNKIVEIASIALANYKEAQIAVLAGDREQGGAPSADLLQMAGQKADQKADQKSGQIAKSSSPKATDKKVAIRQSTYRASHSSQSNRKTSWLKRLQNLFTQPIGTNSQSSANDNRKKDKLGDSSTLSTLLEKQKLGDKAAFAAPQNFVDYAAEGEEPADLALADLAPSDLSLVNLPSAQANTQFTETETDPDSAELGELIPDLSAFSQSPDSTTNPAAQPAIELPTAPNRMQSSNVTIRMTVEHLDQLSQSMGELLTHQNRQALYNEQLANLARTLLDRIARQQTQLNQQRSQGEQNKLKPHLAPQSTSLAANIQPANLAYAQFDAIELDQYSDVQLLAQSFLEETVQQSESAEAIELFVSRAGRELEKQKRILANTRETLLEARMLPLEKVFQRFPTALERLKLQHNKPVNLVLKGENVLVDKVIADKLYDPLLHLVRNAFDHGIETAEQRQAQNKSTTGTITIEALQQGRHLVINVKDDGKGFDLETIRRKAIENQVITAAAAADLTPAQTIDLLFEAGFSTASEVNDLSGRGVGLDAVRAQVRSLKGWVTVSHEPGAGSCFSLQIPSSLTIAKLLLCQAKGRIYALIADAIEHILIPTPQQMNAWEGGKTLTWQANNEEYIVPVNALSEVLRYASPMPNHRLSQTRSDIKAAACEPVIMLRHQNSLVGLEVDQLLGEQELVISSLGETVVPPPYLYGSSILPDGQLTLVLDGVMLAKIVLEQRGQGIIEISTEDSHPHQVTTDKNEPIFVKKLILAIDDSITVRNALAEALQKADYQVIQARDGAEALQQLDRYSGVSAILCDIEMPGMNGFEFLKVRQRTPKIAAIPTIMLTSRAGAKHRLLTKELGATTYITKPYLTPHLLKTVGEAIEGKTKGKPEDSTKRNKTEQLSMAGKSHE
ncbi:MAG: hybrid sensor histidine kinase/response regulator [Phormidesmis sp.]